MDEKFESLARAIFTHENNEAGCAIATWDHQNQEHQDRYRVAAMVTHLIVLGPVYRMEMAQPATPGSEDDRLNPNA